MSWLTYDAINTSYLTRKRYQWLSLTALCNTRSSAALEELVLVISHCRTDQFSQSFLPAVGRLWREGSMVTF